jgi:hypothetical protein
MKPLKLTRRGWIVLGITWLVLVVVGTYATRGVDSDTGRPTQSSVIDQPFDGRQ